MDNAIQPVMPIGGNGSFGNDSFTWIFGLLILLGLFNGGMGFGGNGQQFATRDQVQNGFDTQNLQAQTRDILSAVNAGTAQAVAATNQSFHDNLAAMQSMYNETARDIAALAVGQANLQASQSQCCCEQKMLVAETGANLSQQIAQNKYEMALGLAGLEQRLTAKMDANEITALRDQVNQLQLAQATAGVVRYPSGWTYNAGMSPFCNSGCGCNNI